MDHLELNEIGRVVFTTGKELFFDPYRRNKQTGSFILIDPITNNTSAVGMIIDRVDAKDMVTEDALATLTSRRWESERSTMRRSVRFVRSWAGRAYL